MIVCILFCLLVTKNQVQAEDIKQLKQEIQVLKKRIEQLESERNQKREKQVQKMDSIKSLFENSINDMWNDDVLIGSSFAVKKKFEKTSQGYRLKVPLKNKGERIDVKVEGRYLVLNQVSEGRHERQDESRWSQSSSYSSSSQTLLLPQDADANQLQTIEENGVLIILLPYLK